LRIPNLTLCFHVHRAQESKAVVSVYPFPHSARDISLGCTYHLALHVFVLGDQQRNRVPLLFNN
jgi:hypothetical protein